MKPGETLGRFRIDAALGGGAFGALYQAFDPLVGEAVALKLLRPELAKDGTQTERLRREVLLARRVQHPAVCRIHDLHEDGGRLFVVMELVRGRTLEALIQERALTPARAARIVERALGGLAAAHAVGVLHRDVKASNVMVRDAANGDDDVVLVDFGVATTQGLAHLTRPGVALGTMGYVAPELWDGAEASAATDVFAAGVTLYAALTGRLPWRGAGVGLAQQMKLVPAAPPSVYAPAVDTPLDEIVLRAIAVDPAARFPSAQALADALAARRAGDAAWPTTIRTAPRAARRAPVVAAGVVAVVALAVGALVATRDTTRGGDDAALADVRAAEGSATTTDAREAPTPTTSADAPVAPIAFDLAVDDDEPTSGGREDDGPPPSAPPVDDVAASHRARVRAEDALVDDARQNGAASPTTTRTPRPRVDRAKAVDRASVERKLAKLQARAEGSTDPRLQQLAVQIADDFAAGRYADADAKLDRALLLVR